MTGRAPGSGEPRTAAPPVVVAAVDHRYGDATALEAVSLSFDEGSSTAIIGPDGVGKSTLLGLVCGVKRLQSGTITVFGGSMAERAVRDDVARRIAYMPQGLGRNLYPTLSVAENIDFHARLFGLDGAERGARIARLLAATGLDPFPDRPAGKLSGGMKQKLSLCCALVHDPDLLVLDEPTTGVDPLSRRQFWNLIGDIRASRPSMTVIVATAYMDEAAGFDRVIAIDHGRVIADDTPAALVAQTDSTSLEDAFAALGASDGAPRPAPFVMPPRKRGDDVVAIEATGLTCRFGDFTAVDHVSFSIPKGEIFGFLGSNGCGKTTTMKMLTGLLSATEGTATLLGRPIDAGDIGIRTRIGYMSQGFSLWEELSVAANLRLHARLYRVDEDDVETRVTESLERFELSAHARAMPADLPLGQRQRLQLAAACLHRPEVLILDEPTSGVDPEARDNFWRHLAELSRKDGVTIFVSTHFMNEAARCDRISLMHQGRVLAQGAPADLVRDAGAPSLEEAFIRALEAASGTSTEAEAKGAAAPPHPAFGHLLPQGEKGRGRASVEADASTPENSGQGPVLPSPLAGEAAPRGPMRGAAPMASLARTAAFARREGLEILRDPVRLSFAVLGSLLLLVLFAYGISFDVENLPFATFDRDRTVESAHFVEAFSGSRYFEEHAPVTSEREAERRLISGELRLVVSIPPEFGRDLRLGRRPEVGVWIDGANTFRAETVKSYVQGVVVSHVQALVAENYGPGTSIGLPIDLRPRFAYNQAFVSVDAITPGVIMLLLMLIPSAMTAVGIAREREIGSIANFQASPASVVEFMIGKQIPYVIVGMVSALTLFACARLFFGVPFRGSHAAFALGVFLYVLAATGFGLMISTLVRTQVAAIMGCAILSVVPSINFSGFINPMSSIDGVARWVGLLFPSAWFQRISIGTFAKGAGVVDLLDCDLALAGFAVFFIGAACLLLSKQEA